MQNEHFAGPGDATRTDTTWLELGESVRNLASELMDDCLAGGADPDEMMLWLGAPAPRTNVSAEQ